MISLYYHFPFCLRKCNYCAFYSLPQVEEDKKDAYLAALQEQTLSYPDTQEVGSVYFGGGTPSLFGNHRLVALLDFLRVHKTLTPDCEITVEVNPKTVDFTFLKALRKAGVNRISVGMQSSDDALLKSLGRTHSFADVQNCVLDARNAGFDNLSLDLLFALPGQSAQQFSQSIDDALALSPEHLSVYSLQLEEGTAFFRNRDKLSFPSEDEEEAQYDLLCEKMRTHGYEHYEISSFAKPGKQSKHNSGYWTRAEYLGFGPSAHSFWGNRRFSNTPSLERYLASPCTENNYKTSERLSEEEAFEERIFLGLRLSSGIPSEWVSREKTARMESLNLMQTLENGNVRLTERGWRVSNAVIGQLLV